MELKGLNEQKIILFIKKLEEITITIKESFDKHTFNIQGETYFTNQDIYELLHISKRTLHEYRDAGKIPYIKFGGKIIYKKSDILKVLDDNYYNLNIK